MTSKENRPMHILRAKQFSRNFLDSLYKLTNLLRRYDKTEKRLLYLHSLLQHRRAMLYFTQPSTRTFLSFQSACQMLGLQVCEIRDRSISSERKGETVEDSIRTFSSYVDLIIMRSPESGLCEKMAKLLDNTPRPVPIINAGSGSDEHPTQALLDIYTLARSFSKGNGQGIDSIDGKTICMVGDLKRGRTARSLSRLLAKFEGVKLIFVSPPEFRIANDLRNMLDRKKVPFQETENFISAIQVADAIYMTRVQDEYDKKSESAKVDYSKFYFLKKHLKIIKPDCVIMHPLPRRDELDPAVDEDPRAKYWRQERNGMWIRVALITKIMGVEDCINLQKL